MEIINIIKAIVFGIVQGITEWLPISSTGHLIILNDLLKLQLFNNFFIHYRKYFLLNILYIKIHLYLFYSHKFEK